MDEADLLAIQNHPLSLSPNESPVKNEPSSNKRFKGIKNHNYEIDQQEYKQIINENMPDLNKITAKNFKQNSTESSVVKSNIFCSSENQLSKVKNQIVSAKQELTDFDLNSLFQNGIIPHPPDLGKFY